MNETIKAKASQRLSRRRRLSCCPLRVSLSLLRGTIVPLLLVLLAVLADASYPSVLPPKHFRAHRLAKKNKKGTLWNYGLSSFSSHTHLRAHGPPRVRLSSGGPL